MGFGLGLGVRVRVRVRVRDRVRGAELDVAQVGQAFVRRLTKMYLGEGSPGARWRARLVVPVPCVDLLRVLAGVEERVVSRQLVGLNEG